MARPPVYRLPMPILHCRVNKKCFFIIPVLVAAIVFAFATPAKTDAESGSDAAEMAAALKDLLVQQATIADNQKKIDEKVTAVAEELRQAKIYTTRAK
jgi:hypothetical protein